jgi:Ca-activated chloride channel family protein
MRLVALLVAATALLPWPFELRPPGWVERLLYNAGERTERGRELYAAGQPDEAVDRLETALRLAGGEEADVDPRLLYNAGTAGLAAGDERRAVELLERAAGAAELPADLVPEASYNLGNARLAAGDLDAAVQAYEGALRLAPDHREAKHNLEVALRRREEQRRLPLPNRRDGDGGEGAGGESGTGAGDVPRPADEPRRDEGPPQGPRERQPGPGEERGELPRFEDQPDMTAEQAAALLAAVENLERRQRQERAAERARRQTAQGKDW